MEMEEKFAGPGMGVATIGWVLFVVGLVVAAVLGFKAFMEAPIFVKFLMVGIYGGLLLLLVSVLRQRLTERKTDKYLDVDI